jgi:hypothetical protein
MGKPRDRSVSESAQARRHRRHFVGHPEYHPGRDKSKTSLRLSINTSINYIYHLSAHLLIYSSQFICWHIGLWESHGKPTGNHCFLHQIYGFPAKCPENQSNEACFAHVLHVNMTDINQVESWCAASPWMIPFEHRPYVPISLSGWS